jgi:hypothetical protein
VVERVEDELVAAWLGVAESMVRESVERETCCRKRKKKLGRRLVFLSTLDSIFSSIRPSTPPLFIGGGRGQSCLYREKISALDYVGKDPNRWFKVASLSCQICRKKAACIDLFTPSPVTPCCHSSCNVHMGL